jgi:hypothetical protein
VAELTTLEEKLAEVLGLAQAAQGATEKVREERSARQSSAPHRLASQPHKVVF